MAAAGGPAGRGARWLVGARARARTGSGADARAPARPLRAGCAHRPVGRVRHARTRRQARILRAGRRAVRRRHERLFQRRHAVLRARADEDARSRHPRDLRLLPCARPCSGSTTAARRGAGRGGRRGLGGNAVSVAEHRLRSRDPRRRPLGTRRPPFGPARHGASRRGGAHSRGGGGVDLACGREGRRPRVGALESEWLVRRGDLRQLCLGRAVRRHPVLEEGTDCPADYGSEARALLAGDDARPVRLGSLARQPDSALDRPRKRARCPTTRSCRRARSTRAPG